MEQPWSDWRDLILAELGHAHPDLAAKTTRIEITRYGHAMAVPVPGVGGLPGVRAGYNTAGQEAPAGLRHGRLSFAHSDWAGYSVFEEDFTLGHVAGA